MDVRGVKRAHSRDERAKLHHVAFARDWNDVRQVPEHTAPSADDNDAGTVATPARRVVRVGNGGDNDAVFGSQHVCSHGGHQVNASVPPRAVRPFRKPPTTHRARWRELARAPFTDGPRKGHGAGHPADVSPRRKDTLHRHV